MAQITSVETFVVSLPRDEPYLGALLPGEHVNARGYIVRSGNGTIYPTVDRSVVVRVKNSDGLVGWGETYGICAPRATCEIINDLLGPVLIGRHATDVETIWDDLYGLMRVRGSFGGFYVDAIAALDIAIWDLRGKFEHLPVSALLGTKARDSIPAYVSGLPAATLEGKVALARRWQALGFNAFKFAAVVSRAGIAEEMAALRAGLDPDTELTVDLHWKFSPAAALELINRLQPYHPVFIEAPVAPEDIIGLAHVAAHSTIAVAAGEEWHTEYVAKPRLEAAKLGFVQPEMAHTGITQFMRIAMLAETYGVQVAPHATIGTGIFLAASLHASTTVKNLWKHEFQHTIFGRNLMLLKSDMQCVQGRYLVPNGIGLGVEPSTTFFEHAELVR